MNLEIEEINFSPSLKIWKSNFELANIDKLIETSVNIIKNNPQVKNDSFVIFFDRRIKSNTFLNVSINNELDYLINTGANLCVSIFNSPFNKVYLESWINIVKSINPIQKIHDQNDKPSFHNHVDLNEKHRHPLPQYTFICYLQMPDNLFNDDGVLYLKDKEENIFSILPKCGDIIIIEGDVPHTPNYAPNSTKDRIVLAGNIRMDLKKTEVTII